MDLTIDELIDFVFGDTTESNRSNIEEMISRNLILQDVVTALQDLKKELGDKEAIKQWLDKKGSRLKHNFSIRNNHEKSE